MTKRTQGWQGKVKNSFWSQAGWACRIAEPAYLYEYSVDTGGLQYDVVIRALIAAEPLSI
jgi:hypothetical protein